VTKKEMGKAQRKREKKERKDGKRFQHIAAKN
jgi:hypothetical protein